MLVGTRLVLAKPSTDESGANRSALSVAALFPFTDASNNAKRPAVEKLSAPVALLHWPRCFPMIYDDVINEAVSVLLSLEHGAEGKQQGFSLFNLKPKDIIYEDDRQTG
jgi:hypothetical protein